MSAPTQSILRNILDHARWAPSGDNMQQWLFEITSDNEIVIHGQDTRDHCVYDLEGHASLLAIGALLQTVEISATKHQLTTTIQRTSKENSDRPTFHIEFNEDSSLAPNPLLEFIPQRTTQRRAMSTRRLTGHTKEEIESSLGESYTVIWLDDFRQRLQSAILMFRNAKIRLTCPEAFHTHSTIMEKNARYSEDRIPDKAVGLDPILTKMMHWSMQSWERVDFLNNYMMGTLMPRIELDLLPGILCGSHFAIISKEPLEDTDHFIQGGMALQRLWLTATQQGLFIQPEMTPLIFSRYMRSGIQFSERTSVTDLANRLSVKLDQLIGAENSPRAVFMGRLGHGPKPSSRSIRKPLPMLMK